MRNEQKQRKKERKKNEVSRDAFVVRFNNSIKQNEINHVLLVLTHLFDCIDKYDWEYLATKERKCHLTSSNMCLKITVDENETIECYFDWVRAIDKTINSTGTNNTLKKGPPFVFISKTKIAIDKKKLILLCEEEEEEEKCTCAHFQLIFLDIIECIQFHST